MLTIQDVGSEVILAAVLEEIKRELPFFKRILKKKVTKQEARELQGLCIRDTSLQDLNFLRFFPNLKELEITDTCVKNFDGLQFCRGLTYFGYFFEEEPKENEAVDFTFLQDLPELEVVCLTRNRIKDVSVFSDLHKVTNLILSCNPIGTIAPLKDMRSLEQLEVEACELSSLDNLDEFRSVKTILVAGNHFAEEQKREYQERYPHIKINFEI